MLAYGDSMVQIIEQWDFKRQNFSAFDWIRQSEVHEVRLQNPHWSFWRNPKAFSRWYAHSVKDPVCDRMRSLQLHNFFCVPVIAWVSNHHSEFTVQSKAYSISSICHSQVSGKSVLISTPFSSMLSSDLAIKATGSLWSYALAIANDLCSGMPLT